MLTRLHLTGLLLPLLVACGSGSAGQATSATEATSGEINGTIWVGAMPGGTQEDWHLTVVSHGENKCVSDVTLAAETFLPSPVCFAPTKSPSVVDAGMRTADGLRLAVVWTAGLFVTGMSSSSGPEAESTATTVRGFDAQSSAGGFALVISSPPYDDTVGLLLKQGSKTIEIHIF